MAGDIFTSVKMSIGAGVAGEDACSVRCVEPERVAATRSRLPSAQATEEVAEVFRLLGEPTRMRILYALRDAAELCVCDLALTVDASETAVSHAMRLLRASGIVRNRRQGRLIYYCLADDRVRRLLDVADLPGEGSG